MVEAPKEFTTTEILQSIESIAKAEAQKAKEIAKQDPKA
jgi:hypothetical protein